jgi:hypothetical protein
LFDGSVLQLDDRIGDDVVVPERVGGGAGVGSDDSVNAVLLDPHQGRLPNPARLGPLEGQYDDRFTGERATLYAIGRFIQFYLFAGSVVLAGLVFTSQWHIEVLQSNEFLGLLTPRPDSAATAAARD